VHSRVINQARDKVLSAKEFVRQAVARSSETPVTPPVSYTGPTVSSESSCTPVSNFDAGTTERLEGTRLEARFIAPIMVTSFESESSSSSRTLEVERAGRRFPNVLSSSRKVPKNRIRQPLTRKNDDGLPALIAEVLWERLTWNTIDCSSNTDQYSIAEAYVASLDSLEKCYDEVDAMVCGVMRGES